MPAVAETASMTAGTAIPALSGPAGKTISAAASSLVLDRGVAKLANPPSGRDEGYVTAVAAASTVSSAAANFAVFTAAAVTAAASAREWPIGTTVTAFSGTAVGTSATATTVPAGNPAKLERQIYQPRCRIVADGEMIDHEIYVGQCDARATTTGGAVSAIRSVGCGGRLEPNAIA